MFPDSGPTARALLTLELLQNRPGIRAEDIARRLGVSERAARRTIAVLREVGVPIEAARGPHGGYRLGRGPRLPPLTFTATEALGLVMAALDGRHGAGRDDDPVGAALGKLINALPQNVGRPAATMRQHAQTTPNAHAAHPDPAIAAALVAAVADQRSVPLTYRTQERGWREQVDPWGVVVRHGHWYLVCHSHRAGAIRTYRVDRVVEVGEPGAGFDLPVDLDVLAVLEDHLGQGWPLHTRVVIDAPAERATAWIQPSWGRLTPHPDDPGRSLLVGSTRNPQMYASERLATLPVSFTIEGGDELRAAMSELAARLKKSVSAEPTR